MFHYSSGPPVTIMIRFFKTKQNRYRLNELIVTATGIEPVQEYAVTVNIMLLRVYKPFYR